MKRYVCIHGHFYQPPRENAWLETIEQQVSAAPYHDWNERINAECYAPNVASRMLNDEDRIINIVNNYASISFNIGPTLMSWLEKHDVATYEGILQADANSVRQREGHGNAIAQVYNHLIMPLASTRDKETQIQWGIADFVHRFRRKPEGLWLAETAVDIETLDLAAAQGISFTILAPRQAGAVKLEGQTEWSTVHEDDLDTTRPYLLQLPSGRSMAVFFYHGALSRAVAFNGLLNSGRLFADSILNAFPSTSQAHPLVHLATDGESYGHHHRHGDMALASCIHHLEEHHDVEVVNYGQYLALHPPVDQIRIIELSSWSCVHGVERWRSDCGCQDGANPNFHQKWREPLRVALHWLKLQADELFEKEVGRYCSNPWDLRNDYISVILNRSAENREKLMSKYLLSTTTAEEQKFVLRFLEMQRNAMLMFTSCAWFFDDISRIETLQVLQYADRVIQIAEGETRREVLQPFLQLLSKAPVNAGNWEDAAEMYLEKIRSARLDLNKVAMHYAAASLFEEEPNQMPLFNYHCTQLFFERFESAGMTLSIGHIMVSSKVTFYERPFLFAALHLGQHHIVGQFANVMEPDDFETMHLELRDAFRANKVSEMLGIMQKYFDDKRFSFDDLFRDEKRKVLKRLMKKDVSLAGISYKKIYDRTYDLIVQMKEVGMPIPDLLRTNMEAVIQAELVRFFETHQQQISRLEHLVSEVKRWKLQPDRNMIGKAAGYWLLHSFHLLEKDPYQITLLDNMSKALLRLHDIQVSPDFFAVQNRCFTFGKKYLGKTETKEVNKEQMLRWQLRFKGLAAQIGVAFTPA